MSDRRLRKGLKMFHFSEWKRCVNPVATGERENKIDTPVMVLSNLSQESDMRRTEEFGAKEFFIKSNTPIMAIVERAIEILK